MRGAALIHQGPRGPLIITDDDVEVMLMGSCALTQTWRLASHAQAHKCSAQLWLQHLAAGVNVHGQSTGQSL